VPGTRSQQRAALSARARGGGSGAGGRERPRGASRHPALQGSGLQGFLAAARTAKVSTSERWSTTTRPAMQAPQHCIPVPPPYELAGGFERMNSKRAREEDDGGGQRHEGEGSCAVGGDGGVLDILATRAVEESRAVGQSDEVVTLQQCKVRARRGGGRMRCAPRSNPPTSTNALPSRSAPSCFDFPTMSCRGGMRAFD
jgi:hypothetical protein